MSCRTIIKYRSVWMGAAMLWIVFFHIPMELPGAGLRLFRQLGYGGVDLCLFASGVGCFYSLSKDPDAGRFLGRRLRRLGPVYLIFMLFWLPWQYTKGVVTLSNLLGNLFGIQYLTALHNEFNWYVSAILVLYVLAPYLKAVIDSAGWRGRVLFLGLLLVLTVPFWMSGTYIIIVTRIPIFYLGMLFAAASAEGRSVRPWQLVIAVALAAVGVAALNWGFEHIMNKMWAYGLHWYPHILIAPPVCVLLSLLMEMLERLPGGGRIVGLLSKIGGYSFEIYLLHFPMVDVLSELIRERGLQEHRTLIWTAGLLVLSCGCVILQKAAHAITGRIRKA